MNELQTTILVVLGNQPLHAYQIKVRVEKNLGRKVASATLYYALGLLRADGKIIERTDIVDPNDSRRQYFQRNFNREV